MPLPASWLKSDIGAVGTAGDANESAGTYTITGAGLEWLFLPESSYAGNPLGDPVVPATRYTGGNITISTVVRELAPFVGGVERVADSLPGFGAFILYKR